MGQVNEVEQIQTVEVKEEVNKPKKQKKKAVTGKIFYKKVVVAIKADEESVTVECIRLKGDEKLSLGEQITVRGELRRRNGMLVFGNGCTFVKSDEQAMDAEVVTALNNLPEGEAYANGFCALTGVIEVIEKQRSELPQKITLYVGALTMFVAAVFFMLMSDLAFNNTSSRLIVAVLLSFGSAILFFLSASYSEKPKIMFLLKGIGVALAVGFVLYLHLFLAFDSYYLGKLDEFEKAGESGVDSLAKTQATVIVTLVLSYLAFVAQVANTVIVAVIKED